MTDKPVPTPEAFFTRQRSSEGVDLPLTLPDGTLTTHSIRIRGIDSDAFKQADAEARRGALVLAAEKITDGKVLYERMREEELRLIAACVVSWTFDRECTPENVVNFLREAPQIADEINSLAARRSLFFKQGSPNSTPSPAPSSS